MRSIFAQSKNQGDSQHLVRELELGDAEYYMYYLGIIGMTPDVLEVTVQRVVPFSNIRKLIECPNRHWLVAEINSVLSGKICS